MSRPPSNTRSNMRVLPLANPATFRAMWPRRYISRDYGGNLCAKIGSGHDLLSVRTLMPALCLTERNSLSCATIITLGCLPRPVKGCELARPDRYPPGETCLWEIAPEPDGPRHYIAGISVTIGCWPDGPSESLVSGRNGCPYELISEPQKLRLIRHSDSLGHCQPRARACRPSSDVELAAAYSPCHTRRVGRKSA